MNEPSAAIVSVPWLGLVWPVTAIEVPVSLPSTPLAGTTSGVLYPVERASSTASVGVGRPVMSTLASSSWLGPLPSASSAGWLSGSKAPLLVISAELLTLDAVTVAPGFEKALGAAFGEDLEASSDRGAPTHWLPLSPLADVPALPEGASPLGAHVKALPELERRIGFIGVVADEATGAALQPGLEPGQQLVTVEGAVWRWDGYTMRAGAPSTAAVRLSQRNRLADIRQQIDGVVAEQAKAQARVDDKKRWLTAVREAEKLCVDHTRNNERQVAESARRRAQEAGEATRAAERAAQSAIAAAERAASQARDRHAER